MRDQAITLGRDSPAKQKCLEGVQTPFITMFMYLGEVKNEQEKKDLAMIIEEVLKQRIRGVKNETGQWITPAFP